MSLSFEWIYISILFYVIYHCHFFTLGEQVAQNEEQKQLIEETAAKQHSNAQRSYSPDTSQSKDSRCENPVLPVHKHADHRHSPPSHQNSHQSWSSGFHQQNGIKSKSDVNSIDQNHRRGLSEVENKPIHNSGTETSSAGQLTPPEARSDEGYYSGSHDDMHKSGDSSDSECENYYVLDFR